jgi:hypothetical protein
VLVDQRQDAQASPIMGLTLHEVEASDVVAMERPQPHAEAIVQPQPASRPMLSRNLEPLTTPDPLNPVFPHLPPRCLQQRGDAAVAIASVFRRQGDDGAGQRILVSRHGRYGALRAPIPADDPTGVALREAVLLLDRVDGLPVSLRGYKFCWRCPSGPATTSASTCFSNDKSATSRLNRAPDPSSDGPDRSAGRRTPCASVSRFARRSRPPCRPAPNSCPGPSAPRSGAALAQPAPHPSSDLASCPAPSVLADPLNQPGTKPAGQVTADDRGVRERDRTRARAARAWLYRYAPAGSPLRCRASHETSAAHRPQMAGPDVPAGHRCDPSSVSQATGLVPDPARRRPPAPCDRRYRPDRAGRVRQ